MTNIRPSVSHQKLVQNLQQNQRQNISSKTINKTFYRTIDEIFPPKISKTRVQKIFQEFVGVCSKFGNRQIQIFCWILEKTVFPREIRHFVGYGYFEFPDSFRLFTSISSWFTILILSLISENASFPLRFCILRTSVLSQGFTIFSRSKFGDRQISIFCQNLQEIIFSREMWLFVGSGYFEFPDCFLIFNTKFSS